MPPQDQTPAAPSTDGAASQPTSINVTTPGDSPAPAPAVDAPVSDASTGLDPLASEPTTAPSSEPAPVSPAGFSPASEPAAPATSDGGPASQPAPVETPSFSPDNSASPLGAEPVTPPPASFDGATPNPVTPLPGQSPDLPKAKGGKKVVMIAAIVGVVVILVVVAAVMLMGKKSTPAAAGDVNSSSSSTTTP